VPLTSGQGFFAERFRKMNIDFPLIITVATLVTGLVWLLDALIWAPRRRAAQAAEGGGAAAGEEPEVPTLVEYSRSFFPVLAIVLVLRSFLVEPFQIPSGSMLPTLEDGDFILVNKFSYGIRLPVLNNKVIEIGDPQRGDVIVFRYPEDTRINYIKRVVGVSGDVVRYENKVLYINGERVEDQLLERNPPFAYYQETLGDVPHRIVKTDVAPASLGQGEWVIPEGQYFVMGDNRDNSNDSRFWGFVPDENVVGKAFAIWMHWKPIFSIPTFSRVGVIE